MANHDGTLKSLFSPAFSAKLFLVCAFPLHVWTLLMAFRDFAWVAARTYPWDAVGLVAYALLVALLETLAAFLLVGLVGLILPRGWDLHKRLAMLGSMFWVVASWSILSKVYSAFGSPIPPRFLDFLSAVGHPLRILWGLAFALVAVSAGLPAWLILKRASAVQAISNIFDRITLLSGFYLILDLIGIIIIGIRNIH